jgi:hypothetical protein
MKCLAEVLREDGAVAGDIYDACGYHYKVTTDGELHGAGLTFTSLQLEFIPAEGWQRFSPRRPRVMEFLRTVTQCGDGSLNGKIIVSDSSLRILVDKYVKVRIEECI